MEKYILNSFTEKFGTQVFCTITQTIKDEIESSNCSINVNDDYILYIFEVAIFMYCGISLKKIAIVIKGMGNTYIPAINFTKLIEIHKGSLNMILQYLNSISS